jgi:NADH:ubiquinone oxidoreductase subunit E
MSATTLPSSRTLPEELYKQLENYIDELAISPKDPRRKGYLIQILHRAQHIFGYLPSEVQEYVAVKLFIHRSEVSGVISFYNFFTTTPKGKITISMCMGTACYVKGADKILSEFEKQLNISSGEITEDGLFSLEVLRCVGACGLAPVALVGDKVYGRIKLADVKHILEEALTKYAADHAGD